MADIALVTANKVSVVEAIQTVTLPAAEAITAGNIVRLDTANGKITKANGSSAAEARVLGVALKTVAAGEPVTVLRRGVLDGFNFDAQAWDAPIYASNTDGTMADAAGTSSFTVGRVLPGHAQRLGTALDKLLAVEC